jgi:lysozyme
MKKGIDVSKWNGDINFRHVANSGVEFVMIRSSYGDGSKSYRNRGVDPLFLLNYRNARDAGLSIGVYHYCYARTVEEAKREARFFLACIEGKTFDYPVVADIEDERAQGGLSIDLRTRIACTYLEEIENAGYYAMLYSSKHWLETKFRADSLKSYDIWVAQWASKLTYRGKWGIWQYTDRGRVPGIAGVVDKNRSAKDYSSIIKKAGKNGYSLPDKPSEIQLISYATDADKRAAEYLADALKLPTWDVRRGPRMKTTHLYLGPKRLKPDGTLIHLSGKDRYDTMRLALNYIDAHKKT